MSKRIVIAFFLTMDVGNEVVDSVNKSLTTFNNEPPHKNWDYTGYVAKCINIKDDDDQHEILNIEILNDDNKLIPNEIEELAEMIQGYLEESEEISVDHYALAESK